MLILLIAQASFATPIPIARADVARIEAWEAAAVRQATAHAVAADLPQTPRRFRFQCAAAQAYVPGRRYAGQRCIAADTGLAPDLATLASRAAAQAVRGDMTADDRLRRVAWLRIMWLHPLAPADDAGARSFIVEEEVGVRDLPQVTAAKGELRVSDISWAVPPQVDYPPSLLREDAGGRVDLLCRIAKGGLACRTPVPERIATPANADGTLSPEARRVFLLLHAAHRAARGARVEPTTRDGRPTEGMDLRLPINFRIEE